MEAKIKLGKIDGDEEISQVASSKFSHGSSSFSKPSWLLLTIADLDDRIKMLRINIDPEEGNADDSFAKRAEAYYQQRPQLLNLLEYLYNSYLSLADRYSQQLSKNHHHRRRFSSPISPLNFDECDQFNDVEESTGDVHVNDSDAESSLSYQMLAQAPMRDKFDVHMIIADLVTKTVDYEIVVNELSVMDSGWNESSRKIELQKSLLEVLESERLILLSENATLSYRLNALAEENRDLVSESLFTKRRAAELARCVLKMREDQRVCILSRKIECLQGQIYALERRNKDYYEQLVKQDKEETNVKAKANTKNRFVASEVGVRAGEKGCQNGSSGVGKRASKLWDRVKNIDILVCGSHFDSAYC